MKVEIDVPNKLSDITLEQYQAFMRVVDDNDSEEFVTQKMIALFCKIKLSQVLYFKASSVNEIKETLLSMLNEDKQLIHRFELGGKEFGFIPDLENIEFGEYIDLETNITDWQNMHKAMAVMFRPIIKTKGDKYDIEPYEGTATYSEVMQYAPLDVVMGAMVFFYSLRNELLKTTLNYLEVQLMKMSSQHKRNSENSGDGTLQSMQLLEGTLESLRKSQDYQPLHVLPSLLLKSRKTQLNETY